MHSKVKRVGKLRMTHHNTHQAHNMKKATRKSGRR